jgi:hypothetical protein
LLLKIRSKVEASAVFILVFLLCNSFLVSSPTSVSKVRAQIEYPYKYYGYVPAKIYQYNLTNPNEPPSDSNKWRLNTGSPSRAGVVAVVGMKNNTHIKVSYLNGTLVSEATINSMQKHYVIFPNDTFFKVETSELACVLLLNYGSYLQKPLSDESIASYQNCSQAMTLWAQYSHELSSYPLPFTFYQDINGAYAGKEFILLAVQYDIYLQYTIFALEKATITVTREDGQQWTYRLEANKWQRLMWEPFMTYKIESTGNIMIHSGNIDVYTFFLPSAEGGFVGTTFYSLSSTSFDTGESYGFRASATKDSKITVWNLETQTQMFTADVTAYSGYGFKPTAPAIVVQSDKPITLEYVHNGSIGRGESGIYGAYGSGVGYFGVRPNENTSFYLPMESNVGAYVFASEDTQVTLDGVPRAIKADSYYLYNQPGTHVISSNKNVIVETLNWPYTPENQGLQYAGTQIPCVQTVGVVPNVTLTSIGGGGFPITYVIIGVAAAIVVIAAFLFVRSRGKSNIIGKNDIHYSNSKNVLKLCMNILNAYLDFSVHISF